MNRDFSSVEGLVDLTVVHRLASADVVPVSVSTPALNPLEQDLKASAPGARLVFRATGAALDCTHVTP
jgi:hypothetical protein